MKTIIRYIQPNSYVEPQRVHQGLIDVVKEQLPLLAEHFGDDLADQFSWISNSYDEHEYHNHNATHAINHKFAELYPEYQI